MHSPTHPRLPLDAGATVVRFEDPTVTGVVVGLNHRGAPLVEWGFRGGPVLAEDPRRLLPAR